MSYLDIGINLKESQCGGIHLSHLLSLFTSFVVFLLNTVEKHATNNYLPRHKDDHTCANYINLTSYPCYAPRLSLSRNKIV